MIPASQNKILNFRQQKFVAEMMRGKTPSEAAQAAGYSKNQSGQSLINKNPHIRAALEEAQAVTKERANYNGEAAMAELNDAILFAKETKNATALTRAIELKAKLAGLLNDNPMMTASFTINITGVDPPPGKLIESMPEWLK